MTTAQVRRVSENPGRESGQFRRQSERSERKVEELGGASDRFRRATEGSRFMTKEFHRCCAVALFGETPECRPFLHSVEP